MFLGSLHNVIQAGGCKDELKLCSIAKQLCIGLNFLHEQRFLHRDIKPSNALVSSNGRVKLADFGLAKYMDVGESLAESFVGTFDYMAPERLRGATYSFSSDVWSIGLTIHAVAIGSYPFNQKHTKSSSKSLSLGDNRVRQAKSLKKPDFWGLLHATQEKQIPLPPKSFSGKFRDFIAKACTKEPDDRWSTSKLLTHPFLEQIPDIYKFLKTQSQDFTSTNINMRTDLQKKKKSYKFSSEDSKR